MVRGTQYKVHGLILVWSLLLVGCSQSTSIGFLHPLDPTVVVVTDSLEQEPDHDYLAEFRKLGNQRISSFRDFQVGDSVMSFPIAADNFIGLKYIQQTIIRRLMGADYANDYIQDAIKRYCQENPGKADQLALRTRFNGDNIYACENRNQLMVFNISTGVQLHLRDLFQGDYYDHFMEMLGEDNQVDLTNFTICPEGVLFETDDADGNTRHYLVDKAVARQYLTDKWRHLWR